MTVTRGLPFAIAQMVLQVRQLPPETLSLYVTAEGYYFEPNYAYAISDKPTVQILRPSGTILVNGNDAHRA